MNKVYSSRFSSDLLTKRGLLIGGLSVLGLRFVIPPCFFVGTH